MSSRSKSAIDVAKSADVPELGRLIVDVGTVTVGIFRVDGQLFAYDNTCPHQGGPVCQGRILPKVRENIDDGGQAHGMTYDRSEMHLVCPWHGAEYLITTGAHATVPEIGLRQIAVQEIAERIYVEL